MKRILPLFLALAATVTMMAGCSGSGAKLEDGIYTAQADDSYVSDKGYGWRDTLTITVKDGQMTDATFDAYDADGNPKSVPGNYGDMQPPPSDWIPQLSENVLSAGLEGTVDGVAGATMSSGNVQKLLDAIEESGEPGGVLDVAL